MRVAMATIFNYPHAGGLSTHVNSLTEALRERGVDALTVSPSRTAARLHLGARLPASALRMVSGQDGSWLVYSQEARARILRGLLREAAADVVAAQDVIAARVAAELGLPCVLTVHGYLAREAVARGAAAPGSLVEAYLVGQERMGYRLAQAIVTVDERLRRHVLSEGGTAVTVIENFVPRSWGQKIAELRCDREKSAGLRILCPRRLTAKNGAVVAVRALALLPPQYELDIVGDGEAREATQQEVERLRLTPRVRFWGRQDREGTARAYAAADVVVIPSLPVAGVEEATSIAALEAMAAGIPTVASAIGGLKQIIRHGVTGLLVPPGDPGVLAETILSIDERMASELGTAAALEIANKHSAAAAAQRFANIYEKVRSVSEPRKLKAAAMP